MYGPMRASTRNCGYIYLFTEMSFVMKKMIVLITLLVMFTGSSRLIAGTVSDTTRVETTTLESEVVFDEAPLLLRLDEINNMDKSELTRAEKKELREEVKSIKGQLEDGGGGGLYISVGALLIIVLLLILLL